MPVVNGRFVAPRNMGVRFGNAPLAAVYLAFDLIEKELQANGGDWDGVLSSLRAIRGESPKLRRDGVTYNEMHLFIQERIRRWGVR